MLRTALPHDRGSEDPELVQYLTTKHADCPLLMWGAETKWNFMARRRSPSRYCYIYPLLYPGYRQQERFQELLRDLEAHPDTVIVDTEAGTPNGLGKVDRALGAERKEGGDEGAPDETYHDEQRGQFEPGVLERLRTYVSTEYRVDKVFSNKWVAYVPRTGGRGTGDSALPGGRDGGRLPGAVR